MSTSYGQRSTWGRAQASWALGEQFALVAAGGTRAPEPAIGRVGGNFLSLGVRLASAPWIAHALHAGARSTRERVRRSRGRAHAHHLHPRAGGAHDRADGGLHRLAAGRHAPRGER